MIWITGDTHGDFTRFSTENFPEQKRMTRADTIIVCGDFGGVWNDSREERATLKWLSEKPFTLVFVDGNHENFDRLRSEFDITIFHDAKAHKIRDNIYHICRGEVMFLEGKTFWCFGGAQSHDISDGILDPADFASNQALNKYKRMLEAAGRYLYRIKGVSWWPEEMPDKEEMERGLAWLAAYGNKIDYIVTHCCPAFLAAVFSAGRFKPDPLTEYFNEVSDTTSFNRWFFGHYHRNWGYDNYEMLYERMVRVL